MAVASKIEWTEATWNPISGCNVLSPGCTNCYAMRMAHRLGLMGQEKYEATTRLTGGRPKWTGVIKFDERALELPKRWTRGRLIFVNSMSDLFHERVPFAFIERVFDVMAATPQHTYQVLTKRAERLQELSARLFWPRNVWMGVSVEKEDYWSRVERLRNVNAHVRFLSLEPLLGPLHSLDLTGIHWVIAGGESGPKARPVRADWVRAIRDACIRQEVPFHFKQWGGVNKKAAGRILDDRTWDQLPAPVVERFNPRAETHAPS
jgi:protein gp37